MVIMPNKMTPLAGRIWQRIHADERGLTTLEYIIGAAVILVVLAAAVTVWNNGLADKINQLVQQLMGTS
jgi:Flp pilus assembly pilin Flp